MGCILRLPFKSPLPSYLTLWPVCLVMPNSSVTEEYVAQKQADRKAHLAFDVESWYPLLEDLTFYTHFLPLSPAHARAITAFYGARYNSRQEEFHPEHAVGLRDLRRVLGEVLQRREFKETGAFVRLSSRSPKDGVPFKQVDVRRAYQEALGAITSQEQEGSPGEHQSNNQPDENLKMRALSRASASYWRVRSGDDAMSLLLSSERVFVDLNRALICLDGSKLNEWNEQVSVRQWQDALEDQFEFRCFVRSGHLVAISQYNHYCRFPDVLNMREAFQQTVSQFCHERVLPRLTGVTAYDEGYIVDVGVLPDRRCVVVELNPYQPSTGACLFDWKRDAQLLTDTSSHSQQKDVAVDDESCVDIGSPPLRARLVPMPNLGELVELALDEAQLEGEESYLDILEAMEINLHIRSLQPANTGKSRCVCQ